MANFWEVMAGSLGLEMRVFLRGRRERGSADVGMDSGMGSDIVVAVSDFIVVCCAACSCCRRYVLLRVLRFSTQVVVVGGTSLLVMWLKKSP